MAVYAVSDLHGCYDVFIKGIEKISPGNDDFLYVLGDAIDRGKDGIKILQYVMSHENMDLIIGNHEFMMLNSVSLNGEPKCNGMDKNLWLYSNGGLTTFEQYMRLTDNERLSLLEWLGERYVIRIMELGNRRFCLTHSFYNASCENKRHSELQYKDVWSITWSSIWRDDSLTHAVDIYSRYDYTFITGHVPVQRIRRYQEPTEDWNSLQSFRHGNLINIDGGCALGHAGEINNGPIFIRLDDMKEFPVPMGV